MSAYKERCSRGNPCVFCGDVGLDMRVHYPESDEIVHWCHKVRAGKKGDVVVGRDGREYVCITPEKETTYSTMGTFSLYKLKLSLEEWKEKQRRTNPNWTEGGRPAMRPARVFKAEDLYAGSAREEGLLPGEAEVLSPKELDARYRKLLSMLTLEDWHRNSLLKDWQGGVTDVSRLLDKYPIRSLPPADDVRFSELGRKVKYKNPSRKELMGKLFDAFSGGLAGTPGLYERSGERWDARPVRDRWTIATRNGGIIFPTFDKDGLIYRIRLKIDHPDLYVKEKYGDAPYRGGYGYFTWQMAEDGLRCYFVRDGSRFEDRVEVPEGDARGKASGKYINFSSFLDREVDGKVVNHYLNGCQSGSPYGLYGTDMPNKNLVILTEGEKKAMVSSECCGCRAVSIPGVSSFNVIFREEGNGKSLYDALLESGAQTFLLCYDADKDHNADVLKNEGKFAQALYERGAQVMIGSWSSKYDKGLDDLLLLGVRPTCRPYVPQDSEEQ